MNTASKNLTKHLNILQDKLSHPIDYELALSYFLDEFSGDVHFHSQGIPDEAPHLRVSIDAVVSKATGVSMISEQFICSILHGHDLFHGLTASMDRTVVFFYSLNSIIAFANAVPVFSKKAALPK